jgi:hypothetical protein
MKERIRNDDKRGWGGVGNFQITICIVLSTCGLPLLIATTDDLRGSLVCSLLLYAGQEDMASEVLVAQFLHL